MQKCTEIELWGMCGTGDDRKMLDDMASIAARVLLRHSLALSKIVLCDANTRSVGRIIYSIGSHFCGSVVCIYNSKAKYLVLKNIHYHVQKRYGQNDNHGVITHDDGKHDRMDPNFSNTTACCVAFASSFVLATPTLILA